MVLRFLLAAVLAAGFAFAQGGRGGGGGDDMGGGGGGFGGGGGMGGMGEGMGGGMRAAQKPTKAEQFMDKLKLNKDQKEEAVKILGEAAQKAAPIRDQINKGRQMIGTSILQKKSVDEMKPLMDAYTAVCGQMTALEVDAFSKIYAQLKPNQQKNAAQAFELMAGIFFPPVSGGGRGMGRPMGGMTSGADASMSGSRGRGGRD
jgi:hypothetical protein